MSQKIRSSIDLQQNQIYNAILHKSATPPENAVNGQIYFNTFEKAYFYFVEGDWVEISEALKFIDEDDNGLTIKKWLDGESISIKVNTDGETITIKNDNLTLVDGGVENKHLAIDSVCELNIQDNSVSTNKVIDRAITSIKLALDAVETENIKDGAITADKIAKGAIDGGDLGEGTVTEFQLADGAVTNIKIADGAVTSEKIADDSVTNGKVVNGAITADKLGDNAVTNGKIVDGAITAEKIADLAISNAKITDGAITADKLADNSVTNGKVVDGAVTTEKIANGSITLEKLADGLIDEGIISDGSITTVKLANNAVTTDKIADKAIEFNKIKDIKSLSVLGNITGDVASVSEIDIITDFTNVGSNLATSEAIKNYVDAGVATLGSFQGGYNVKDSNDRFPSKPNQVKTILGDYWLATSEGVIKGLFIHKGDVVVAKISNPNPSEYEDWFILEGHKGLATSDEIGFVTLAESLNVINGVDGDGVVTLNDLNKRQAKENVLGMIEIASFDEIQAGIKNDVAVTPKQLKEYSGNSISNGDSSSDDEVLKVLWTTGNEIKIQHGFNSKNVSVHVFSVTASKDEVVLCPYSIDDKNSVTVRSYPAPDMGDEKVTLRVVIQR